MNRELRLAKNTIILAIGTFLPKITALITLPILTGYLSKAEYGTYDIILAIVALLLPVASLKIDAAAFRFLIECRDDEKEVKTVISTILIFLCLISVIAVFILSFFLKNQSIIDEIAILIYVFLDILLISIQMITRGLSRNMVYSISAVLNSVVSMLLTVVFVAYFRCGLTGVLFSLIIGTGTAIIFITWKISLRRHFDFSAFSVKKLKEMLSYSWPMVPNSLSLWAMDLSDRLIITSFLGIEFNAAYAVAQKIPNLFGTVQSTFIYAWQENASLAANDEDNVQYYSGVFHTVYCIMVGAMALLISITPLLFKILIKGNYTEAYYQIPILFMGILSSTISSFMGGIYVAHKKTMSVGITTIVAACINLVIDFLLVRQIGIWAGSISTLVSYLFLAIYRMIDVQKFQKINYNYLFIGITVASLAVMCIFCWMNNLFFNVLNCIIGVLIAVLTNRKLVRNIVIKLRKG